MSDNSHGLIASAMVTFCDGHAELEAAKTIIGDARQIVGNKRKITLGADKGYGAREFIEALQEMNIVLHVAQNTSGRRSAVPDTIADSAGYVISQQKCKLIEQGFGRPKTIGPVRQVIVRGVKKAGQLIVPTIVVCKMTRMRTLGQIRVQVA